MGFCVAVYDTQYSSVFFIVGQEGLKFPFMVLCLRDLGLKEGMEETC